jgi:pimeloyl-ACP methyl ester carboxylesterase
VDARYIRAEGLQLFAESFGDPADPPILLIMGAMASGVWWPEEFCTRLAVAGRYVVRYDHRDTGHSTSYAPGSINYSLEDLSDDAVRVLDGYGIARAHLVGMSLGGLIAQLFALKYQARVATITLIDSEPLKDTDPSIPPMSPEVPAYHAQAEHLDWSDRDSVIDYQVDGWRILTGSAHPFIEEDIRALAEEDFDRTPDPRTPMNHALLAGGERWYDRLDEIEAPTLIIHGTEDPVLPYQNGIALAEGLSQARLLTLEGSGHELHRNDWDTLVEAIAEHTRP